MRDIDKTQSYRAEDVAFRGLLLAERQSYDSLVAQTRAIEDTVEWRSLCTRKVTIGYTKGSRDFAHPWSTEIAYADNSKRYAVVHEMTHLITPGAMHGHEWRTRYVWLMRIAYGDEWADALAHGFLTSKLGVECLPVVRSTPVFPPAIFETIVGEPLIRPTTTITRGPIAL